MKYMFDIGDAKEVVCDTEEPFLRLSFRILSADGITYYAYGKSRLVKDKGWLLLTIADNLVSSCFGDRKTQFVCATNILRTQNLQPCMQALENQTRRT